MERLFYDTLNREGKDITINAASVKVFFRKNDSSNTDTYNTLYAPLQANIEQGNTFTYKGVTFLILKALTVENDVYRKYTCVKCNETIKYELVRTNDSTKADLTIFDAYMVDGVSDSLNNNKNVITVSSKTEFKLPLNDLSRRLTPNSRFYCGAYFTPWIVTDINYKDNICTLYCERTTVSANDDTNNGIADRWLYETKPDNYVVNITESTVLLDENATQQLNVTVTKNDATMTEQPTINWTSTDSTIAYVDADNKVVGVKEGSCVITGDYKVNANDTCTDDSIAVTVNNAIVVGDIVIAPVYNNSTYYKVRKGSTQSFVASISGLDAPQWNITLNTLAPSTAYTSTIDNASGTFTVKNINQNVNYLVYTIAEQTTGKSVEYQVLLGAMF